MKRLNEILKNIFFLLTPSSAENIKVVVLCVLAATTFWFFTALNKTYTTRINYPVEFSYEGKGLMAVQEIPNTILVDVTGGGWNLLRRTLWWNITPVSIPLENVTNIRYIKGAALYPEISTHLKDIKLNYIATDTLFFDIQKSTSKKLKVIINDSSISLDNGFRISSKIALNQDCVTITGPEKILSTIPNTIEAKITKKEISRNFKEKVRLPGFENKLVRLSTNEVEVSFEVSRFISKQFEVDIRKVGFSEDLSKLIPKSATLLITIRESELKNWESGDFELIAYRKDFKRADSSVALTLTQYPTQIKEVSLKDPKLKLKYE